MCSRIRQKVIGFLFKIYFFLIQFCYPSDLIKMRTILKTLTFASWTFVVSLLKIAKAGWWTSSRILISENVYRRPSNKEFNNDTISEINKNNVPKWWTWVCGFEQFVSTCFFGFNYRFNWFELATRQYVINNTRSSFYDLQFERNMQLVTFNALFRWQKW